MKEVSASRKQLYIGMAFLIMIALLLIVKMAYSDTPVPDGISYLDEKETIVSGFTNQEAIVVPEGVVSIDVGTTYATIYDEVSSLTLPSTLKDIKNIENFQNAFPNVKEIVIGTDSSCQGYYYETGIFYQRTEGKVTCALIAIKHLVVGKVVMPDTVKYIRSGLFVGCDKMTSLTIGNEFEYVDYGTDNYEYLDGTCFAGCDNLKEIRVAGKNKFYKSENDSLYCKDVDTLEDISFAEWKLHIVPQGYEGEYVVSPNTVTIGVSAFYECNQVTSICITEGVTEIKEHAIVGCDSLEHITIPPTVQYINQSFVKCENLAFLKFTGDIYYRKVNYDDMLGENTKVETIFVPEGCVSRYKAVMSKKEARFVKEGDYQSDTPLVDELEETKLYVKVKGDGSIYFQWKQVPYAEGYRVQMECNGWWKNITTLKRTHSCYVKSLTITDIGMKEGNIYHFRIVAYAGQSITSTSEEKSVCYIASPEIIAVKNKEAEALFVRWKKNENASGYYVELLHHETVEKTFRIEDISETSMTIEGLKKGGVYCVRVYAYKEVGEQTLYSEFSSETKNIVL